MRRERGWWAKGLLFEPRIELGTFSVLDWRDNQLHHPNTVIFQVSKLHNWPGYIVHNDKTKTKDKKFVTATGQIWTDDLSLTKRMLYP